MLGAMRWARVAVAIALAGCRGPSAPATAPHAGSGGPTAAAATAAPVPSKGMVEGGVRPHHEEAVVECGAQIPDSADDDARVSALLDEANKDLEQGTYAAAWTCADRATDLAPTSS